MPASACYRRSYGSGVRDSWTKNTYKSSYKLTPLKDVANAIKRVPSDFINEEGNGVTQKLIDYVLPFIDEDEIAIKSANIFLKHK